MRGKLLGQVFLLRHTIPHLPDGGSVTLTAGRIPETLRGSAFGVLTNADVARSYVEAVENADLTGRTLVP
ncbi:hypothetical protein ABT256_36175 [Amycolatopsis japonica]|uniref:hypothetical protein n=1 Tax=Amycolatopsis japonica TaxID=208439 RepID=UPI00333013DF